MDWELPPPSKVLAAYVSAKRSLKYVASEIFMPVMLFRSTKSRNLFPTWQSLYFSRAMQKTLAPCGMPKKVSSKIPGSSLIHLKHGLFRRNASL